MRGGWEQVVECEEAPFVVGRTSVTFLVSLLAFLLKIESEVNPDGIEARFMDPEDQFAFLWYDPSLPMTTRRTDCAFVRSLPGFRYFMLLTAAGAKSEDGKNLVPPASRSHANPLCFDHHESRLRASFLQVSDEQMNRFIRDATDHYGGKFIDLPGADNCHGCELTPRDLSRSRPCLYCV
jgi:hypothetical protein